MVLKLILLFYPDKVAVLVDAVDVKFPGPEVEEGIDVGDVIDEEDGGGAAVERVRDRAIPFLAAGVPHDETEQSDLRWVTNYITRTSIASYTEINYELVN